MSNSSTIIDSRFESLGIGQKILVCAEAYIEHSQRFDKEQLNTVWVSAERTKTGKPKSILVSFNPTLRCNSTGVPSNLRTALIGILGRDPGLTFDYSQLIGINALVTIGEHTRKDGGKTVKATAFEPLPAGTLPLPVPADYKRRTPKAAPVVPTSTANVADVFA